MTHIVHIVNKQRKRNALLAISTIGVCFSTAFHCVTIVKFQMTADQSLYVKVLKNVNIYQIEDFFSGNIKTQYKKIKDFIARSVKCTHYNITKRTIMFEKNTQLILQFINKCPCKTAIK